MLAATRDYLDAEDALGTWLEECTERVIDGFESRQLLFSNWQDFCKRTGEDAGTRKQFVQALDGRDGLWPHKREGIRGYRGIRLTWSRSEGSET